ncbi:SDR family NAD(P)-dependent oxidoreductase [Ramlibacter sp. MAHUQ-53]|uniref:SDR family NAD(P)-dependent oxidoreductase n=1 Tax=unclassified Ramlibacter TaxID=2617605 RepID=UPI00363F09EB
MVHAPASPRIIPGRFEGRVALVTGGASGMGRATVDRLVAEGARVAVWDIDAARLDAVHGAHGPRVLVQQVDVTDDARVQAAMAQATQHFGRLDILVNGAGIVGDNGPFWDVRRSAWDRILAINLTAALVVSQAALPHLRRQGGHIVNIASVAANEGPKNIAAYAASKAGLVGLTKSMGKELAGSGVVVNAIAPALVATELLSQLTPEYMQAALARIPMGRAGSLDEAAAMITWMCSQECSFCTGAVFDLSGGRGV